MKNITVGILAHVDAGKTTLAEAMLFNSGVIRNQGRVDHKNTALDTHRLEKERGITIFAGEASFSYRDTKITLIDTPGHVDFSAETERMISVMDYAVIVINAVDGVEAHTRTVKKLLDMYGIPTFIFVTKCDLERNSREFILNELEKEFGQVVDFSVSDGLFSDAEKIAMCDENLLEEYLQMGNFSDSTLVTAIKTRRLFPCFFGSGLKNQGVGEFISALDKYTSQIEYPSVFGAKVYKITHDKSERITKLKVTGGCLRVKDSIEYNGITEKINRIMICDGVKFISADEAPAGSVCVVTGLSKTSAGQGLGSEIDSRPSLLEPVIRYRIILPKDCDPRVMLPKFKSLEEEDPKLNITYNEISGDFHCSLMGNVQAEILKSVIYERFDTDIEVAEGKVIYKETVTDTVEGVGHYEPLRHYAEVHLLIEPNERSKGNIFTSKCSENELDRNWQRLVLTHLSEKTHIGKLTGSPLTDVKISLVSGKAHLKHTEGGDFRQATYRAVRQGLMQAECILLEPYYSFRLEIPVKHIGRAITDIKLKGGSFSDPENDGETAILKGKAPVITMDGYMAEVSSYTGGMGRLSLELFGYERCHNEKEVIASFGYDPERDTDNPADSVFCAHGAGFNVKWRDVKNYMHLESYFSKSASSSGQHRHITIDEKELEAIMIREFGTGRQYYNPVSHSVPTNPNEPAVVYGIKNRCLIIDGYNLIFSWDYLKELAQQDLDGARETLCNILANYLHFTGCRVVLVFDGYKVSGNKGEKFDRHGINVVFTAENETGDNYIEKLIDKIGKNEQVRVVTSDSMIQLSAVRTGVFRMSSKEFIEELSQVDKEISDIINKV